MGNEYYGAPTTPTSDYLVHYGIPGMKWGVRKAAEKGAISGAAGFANKRLGREYKKAQKKLAKLEKRATGGSKYAKRAAALGAGAAVAGGLAAAGTMNVARGIGAAGNAFSKGAKATGGLMQRAGLKKSGAFVSGLGKHNASGVATAVQKWGGQKNIGEGVGKAIENSKVAKGISDIAWNHGVKGKSVGTLNLPGGNSVSMNQSIQRTAAERAKGISNSGYARIGAAALGAGLGIGAGYNAYRAATTKRAARKAAEFRKEMNKAFAGTSYANAPRTPQKRRRRG